VRSFNYGRQWWHPHLLIVQTAKQSCELLLKVRDLICWPLDSWAECSAHRLSTQSWITVNWKRKVRQCTFVSLHPLTSEIAVKLEFSGFMVENIIAVSRRPLRSSPGQHLRVVSSTGLHGVTSSDGSQEIRLVLQHHA
jgi:hypothetical protein